MLRLAATLPAGPPLDVETPRRLPNLLKRHQQAILA
jgi:hypothetical protein